MAPEQALIHHRMKGEIFHPDAHIAHEVTVDVIPVPASRQSHPVGGRLVCHGAVADMALEFFQIQALQPCTDEVIENDVVAAFVIMVEPGIPGHGQGFPGSGLGIHILTRENLCQICGTVVDHLVRVFRFHADIHLSPTGHCRRVFGISRQDLPDGFVQICFLLLQFQIGNGFQSCPEDELCQCQVNRAVQILVKALT